jgi:hypothetical protein
MRALLYLAYPVSSAHDQRSGAAAYSEHTVADGEWQEKGGEMVSGRKMVAKMHSKGTYVAYKIQSALFARHRCWREIRAGTSFLRLGHVLGAR